MRAIFAELHVLDVCIMYPVLCCDLASLHIETQCQTPKSSMNRYPLCESGPAPDTVTGQMVNIAQQANIECLSTGCIFRSTPQHPIVEQSHLHQLR